MTGHERNACQASKKAKPRVGKRRRLAEDTVLKTQSIKSFFRPDSDTVSTSPNSENNSGGQQDEIAEEISALEHSTQPSREAYTDATNSTELLQEWKVNILALHDRVYQKRPRQSTASASSVPKLGGERAPSHTIAEAPTAATSPVSADRKRDRESTRLRQSKPVKHKQLYLDLGQKSFGYTRCHVCGLLYFRGEETDESLHSSFHSTFAQGISFQGWKDENVVWRDDSKKSRILLVLANDKPAHLHKVQQVSVKVSEQLGLPSAWLQQVPTKVFLYIRGTKVVGSLHTQDIQTATYISALTTAPAPVISPIDSPQPSSDSHVECTRPECPPGASQGDQVRPDECFRASAARGGIHAAVCIRCSSKQCECQRWADGEQTGRGVRAAGVCTAEGARGFEEGGSRRGVEVPQVGIGARDVEASTEAPETGQSVSEAGGWLDEVRMDSGQPAGAERAGPYQVMDGHHTEAAGGTAQAIHVHDTRSELSTGLERDKRIGAGEVRNTGERTSDSSRVREQGLKRWVQVDGPMHDETEGAGDCVGEGERLQATCGVRAMWVHHDARRQGIASMLLDIARVWHVPGCIVPTSELAFSYPTEAGKALAAKYTKSEQVLIYGAADEA